MDMHARREKRAGRRASVIAPALIGAMLLGMAATAQAQSQVYKWVDADGRTHYSSTKPADPGARPTEIKAPPPPPALPPAPAAGTNSDWPPGPKFRPMPMPQITTPAPAPEPPRALSSGLNRETDAYRCALAKDILSGAMRRRFSATDDHDRNIARSDIKLFCK